MTTKRIKLAECRKRLGLTQEGLAELMEVERSTVVRWELGESLPRPSLRPRLAKILKITNLELSNALAAGGDFVADSRSGPLQQAL